MTTTGTITTVKCKKIREKRNETQKDAKSQQKVEELGEIERPNAVFSILI